MTDRAPRHAVDCANAMERLFDFLDGELGPDLEVAVRAHLAACSHCLEMAGLEKRFLEAVQAARGSECCPGKLRARVLDALRGEGWAEAPEA